MNKQLEQTIDDKLESALQDSPSFGQSTFQLSTFVIGKEITPRSYRQICLELDTKYNDLKKCRIHRRKTESEMHLLLEKIEQETNPHKKIILECDIEEKMLNLKHQEKLILDATEICNWLYSEFEKHPKYTLEQFERAEEAYWKKRIIEEAQLQLLSHAGIQEGHAQSLHRLGINPIAVQIELQHANKTISLEVLNNLKLLTKEG